LLQRRANDKKAQYSLVTAPIWNFLREWLPLPLNIAERGNCALWTSKVRIREMERDGEEKEEGRERITKNAGPRGSRFTALA
jgi:hypothetical protein